MLFSKIAAIMGLIGIAAAQLTPIPKLSTDDSVACVADAATYCNAHTFPAGSSEAVCMAVSQVPWSDPTSMMRSKCYCQNRRLHIMWWDCYYKAVALCPRNQVTMRQIWHQEWEIHRHERRLRCLDDFKPNPPWKLIHNDYMRMHYDTKRPLQYSYDYAKW